MKILSFDTSSSACSVALQNGDVVYQQHKIAPMQHTQLILHMISQLLSEASLTLNELDAIVYGAGPGSFTGIRIATSVAQGLNLATQKPLYSVSSLAAIAYAAYLEHHWQNLLVAVDARMDQIYWAQYRIVNEKIQLLDEEKLYSPQAIDLPEGEWYGVGDGWEKYAQYLTRSKNTMVMGLKPSQLPSALAILKVFQMGMGENRSIGAADALPTYLR